MIARNKNRNYYKFNVDNNSGELYYKGNEKFSRKFKRCIHDCNASGRITLTKDGKDTGRIIGQAGLTQ